MALEPVALFVVGEVADHPAQAIHRFKPATGLLFANAGKGAAKLGAGEAQLVDERVGHWMRSFVFYPGRRGVRHAMLIGSEWSADNPSQQVVARTGILRCTGETAKLGPSFWISHLTPRDTGRAGPRRGVERRPSP